MSKLIYITRKIPESGINLLKEKGYTIDIGNSVEAPSKEDLIKVLSQKPYEGLVSFLTDKIDGEIFDVCPSLKIVAQFAVGFDNIDIKEAEKRGILVTNTPGCASLAVAEHAVALILSLTTRVAEGDKYMKEGKYTGWLPNLLIGTDLSGKIIGILGGGAIGQEVASMLHFGFKCPIIYSDIKESDFFKNNLSAKFVDKETLLKESDVVSLHVPLIPSTKHLINKEALNLMKKDSYLINTSRGPVVDEVALVEALKSGIIRGAGLDVYEFEPNLTDGLRELSNVVLTPHIASARESVRNKMSEIVGENIVDFFENGKVLNGVKN